MITTITKTVTACDSCGKGYEYPENCRACGGDMCYSCRSTQRVGEGFATVCKKCWGITEIRVAINESHAAACRVVSDMDTRLAALKTPKQLTEARR